MNIREGTRRLALLIGVLGATFGGFASYAQLREVTGARARFRAFEVLAKSDTVQQERLSWVLARLPQGQYSLSDHNPDPTDASKAPKRGPTQFSIESPGANGIVPIWKSLGPERREELLGKMTPDQKHKLRTVIEEQSQRLEQDPFAAIAKPISEVNKSGIRIIHWAMDLGVESIETEDGATLYPAPEPSRWLYFLAAIFPVLGFLVPWCSIRALAWVWAGFFEK